MTQSARAGTARWRGWTALLATAVIATAVSILSLGVGADVAQAGTVSVFPQPFMQLATPDTRGGMIMDDKYLWVAHHARGLWRVDRCTGANAGFPRGNLSDGKAWDLWYYDPFRNFPHSPDAGSSPSAQDGYFIYMAGANGTVYIYESDKPSQLAGTVVTGGGVAYGVYATEPSAAVSGGIPKLYVATTSGLMVYDISNPANPAPLKALGVNGGPILLTLDFVAVRGIEGHGYVYANSFTDNKTYIIRISDNTVVGSIAYGGANTLRRPWVYRDMSGRVYLYTVNNAGDLWISDVTNPESPQLITYWNSPAGGPANMPGGAVIVSKDYAFVLTSNGNDQGYIYMLDVRNPYNPVLVDVLYDAAFGFNDLRIDGREIHVAAHDGWKMYLVDGWEVDAQISNWDTSNLVGFGQYEMPASTQVKSQVVGPNDTAVFQVPVRNMADRRDRVQLVGSATPNWRTEYWVAGSDVTTAVLNGTYASPYLEPLESMLVTIRMTPLGGAEAGVQVSSRLNTYSWSGYGSGGT